MKYRTKPLEIEAIQFTGDNYEEIKNWAVLEDGTSAFQPVKDVVYGPGIDYAIFDKLHQTLVGLNYNDYIIIGPKGEYYPCNPEVFAGKYEPV